MFSLILSTLSTAVLLGVLAGCDSAPHGMEEPVQVTPQQLEQLKVPDLPSAQEIDTSEKFVFGDIVTPEKVVEYPHLRPFVGKPMLGNGYVQVVFADIPEAMNKVDYHQAVLAIFDRTPAGWRPNYSFQRADIKVLDQQKNDLVPIGIDLRVSKEKKLVTFVVIFGLSSGRGSKLKISYKLNDRSRVVGIESDEPTGSFDKKFRLYYRGKWVRSPHDAKSQDSTSRYAMARFGSSALAVSGFESLKMEEGLGGALLTLPSSNGFFLHLGEPAVRMMSGFIKAEQVCSKSYFFRGTSVQFQPGFVCSNGAPVTVPYRVSVFSLNQAEEIFPVETFVNNADGFPVAYAALRVNKSETLHLPKEQVFTLQPIGNEDWHLQDSVDSKGKVLVKKVDQLPELQIHSPFDLPGLVKVNVKDSKEFLPYQFSKVSARRTWLTPTSLFARQWPLRLTLPQGEYILTLYQQNQLVCRAEIKSLYGGEDVSLCSVRNVPSIDWSGYTRVDLSGGFHRREGLEDTLGIRIKSVELRTSSAGLSLKNINHIKVVDADLGVGLKYHFFDAKVIRLWNDFKKQNGARESLQSLSQFANTQSSFQNGILEMTCPKESLEIPKLKDLIKILLPDMVQFFGCGSLARQTELMQLYAKSIAGRGRKFLGVSPTSGLGEQEVESRFGSILMSKESVLSKAFSNMLGGQYVVEKGATLFVSNQSYNKDHLNLDLKLSSLDQESLYQIQIWELDPSGNTRLIRRELVKNPDKSGTQNHRASVKVLSRESKVRVELMEVRKIDGKSYIDKLIATSNFFDVNQPSEKRKAI